jgi:hypothetical protein
VFPQSVDCRFVLDFVWVVRDVAELVGFVAEAVFGVLEVCEFLSPPTLGVGAGLGFGDMFRYCLLDDVHE